MKAWVATQTTHTLQTQHDSNSSTYFLTLKAAEVKVYWSMHSQQLANFRNAMISFTGC